MNTNINTTFSPPTLKQPSPTLENSHLKSAESLASIKERSFKSLNQTLSRLGESIVTGVILFGTCVNLGFGLPITVTVTIIAVLLLNAYAKANQKEIVKKIARYEEISEACERALILFPEPIQQTSESQLKEIIKAMNGICGMRNKKDDSDNSIFRSIDFDAESINRVYNDIEKNGCSNCVKTFLLKRLTFLKDNILRLQNLAKGMASAY